MLSWEEFEEKEVKPVKAETQEKKAQPAPQPGEEQVEQPKVALKTGSLSDRLERAKKAVADFDKQTGYFTRSILCVPIIKKDRVILGVTQVLNKRGGPFTEEDEQRLKAFTAQISVGLENAQLFADVQNMKNYNDSILQSAAWGYYSRRG